VTDDELTTNIHALSGLRVQGLCVQAITAYASDREATGTGPFREVVVKLASLNRY
jgi:hypothetical protein